MLTETLFGLLLALTLLIFCTSTRKPDTPAFILLGICLAASWMVNPTALLLPAIFATLALWGNSPSTSELPVLRKPMILVCIFLPLMLVLGGWSLRTAVTVPDRGLDSASRLLMNLNVGMHETFHDRWRADKRDPNNPATLTAAEIGSSYAKFIEVWSRNFRENPVDMTVWYLFKKPYDLWGWDVKIGLYDIYIYPIEYSLYHKKAWANITHQAMKLMHLPILALALLGVCSIRYIHDKGRVPFIAVVAVTAYFTAVYSATQADPRYSFPLRPELYLCATVGLLQLSRLTKRRFFLRRSQAI
jgi:hypothetical protein